ncbi:VOC family protein [Rhodococcus wratislaviensis]|uniref:VOC family protein n=1 Tax=Rhodococcus wratislaviensis TaxID=44752 RepID=UPI001C3F65E1|nr:VOC family protein [Rhodococcus wratislaviensis]
MAIRLGTSDAQQALDKVREAGVTLHNQELVRMEGVPAMFSFTDPDGNGLVYLEETDQSGASVSATAPDQQREGA